MVDEPESRFDADVLMKRACASAKLDDYGDTRFVEPLREYLAGAARYFPFTAAGAARLADGIVNQLVNRLRMTEDLKRHPEILEEDVSDPIVITGMPRTGTTKLQRVLSADTANQSLLYWKVINFARFPDAAPGAPDPRIAVAKAACDQIATANPEVMTAHPFLHDQAEEDCLILDGTYEHFQNAGAVNDERYCAYVQSRPRDNAYRYLHMVLQYLQWQDGGKRGPWVLKSPVHMGYLPEVLSTFPDATIVQGHRDSVAVFGSLCHLVSDLIQPMSWARLDPHQTGRDLLRVWGDAWDQNQANRAALPAGQSVHRHRLRGDQGRLDRGCGAHLRRHRASPRRRWTDRDRAVGEGQPEGPLRPARVQARGVRREPGGSRRALQAANADETRAGMTVELLGPPVSRGPSRERSRSSSSSCYVRVSAPQLFLAVAARAS